MPDPRNINLFSMKQGVREGGRTLRKDVFLPSKHLLSTFRLLSAFYETLPSKNPSRNLVFLLKTLTGTF